MDENIRWMILLVELLILSVQDIHRRKINVSILVVMLIGAIMLLAGDWIIYGITPDMKMVTGILFGVLVAAAGHFTKIIGEGDGAVLILMAFMDRYCSVITYFMMAITIASVTALLLLAIGKVKRKYEIPFIPFLLFSLMGVALWS
ncbi:MAG: hypothetical protein PHW47_06115 [Lachnospira sp.]|nr:hypothetical protein [Lachnospira sp.]